MRARVDQQPMAPIAVSAGALEQMPPVERRRWMVAAAVTGVMMTSYPVARSEVFAPDLPVGEREALEEDVDDAGFGRIDGPRLHGALEAAPARSATPAATTVSADAEPEQVGALPDGPVEVARHGDVRLVVEGSSIELVGFHESMASSALALEPSHPLVSEHPDVASDSPDDDPPVVVLPTRDRKGAPTSAMDLSMAPGEAVVAPISGEVLEVEEFSLYGSTKDVLIRIRSSEDPSIVLTAMHVVGAQVEPGDEVVAGVTPIAAEARQLPFESQIDRFTAANRGQPGPHVHVEMRYEYA